MKKIFLLILLFSLTLPTFSANWFEMFEKDYIDTTSIEVNTRDRIVSFWRKTLRKDSKEKFNGKDYWFTMSYMQISCNDRMSNINYIAVYDLQNEVISSGNLGSEWTKIIPDTYVDGYYRAFCIWKFEENPLLRYAK